MRSRLLRVEILVPLTQGKYIDVQDTLRRVPTPIDGGGWLSNATLSDHLTPWNPVAAPIKICCSSWLTTCKP